MKRKCTIQHNTNKADTTVDLEQFRRDQKTYLFAGHSKRSTNRHLHTYLLTNQGRFKGARGRAPCEKSAPCGLPTARSKVNDVGILLNYVVIASNVYM